MSLTRHWIPSIRQAGFFRNSWFRILAVGGLIAVSFAFLSFRFFPETTPDGKEHFLTDPITTVPGSNFSFDCDDGKKVDLYGTGGNCENNPFVNIPNSANVYQVYTEIVYKGPNPGSQVVVTAAGAEYALRKVVISGTSSNVHVYRGLIPRNVSVVRFPNPPHRCSLQSILVYAFRQGVQSIGQSGIFTAFSGYRNQRTFSIPIPAGVLPRDVEVRVPVSEVTTDCRILNISARAGGISSSVQIFEPDADLGDCCLSIPKLLLEDVPPGITSIDITVESPTGSNRGCPVQPDQNGQSYVVAGVVMADVECNLCIDALPENDFYTTCPNNAVGGNLKDNDARISDQNFRYTKLSNPSSGTLNLNRDGVFNYTPAPNFCGHVSFRYKVCNDGVDDPACCGEAQVRIDVTDTEDPVLRNIPADVTVSCNNIPGVPGNVFATDNCTGNLTPTFSVSDDQDSNGCGKFEYTITRRWQAKDVCGNEATHTQTITVRDTEAPTASNVPANLTVECDDLPPVVAPVFTDNCDANFNVVFSETENAGLCKGNYTLIRKWTATDVCRNTRIIEQLITVRDTEAPSLSDPADLRLRCDQPIPSPVLPNASDNCVDRSDLIVELENETSTQTNNGSCTDFSYTITRIFKATDPCGNASQQVQQIEVTDEVAPVLSANATDLTVECDGAGNTAELTNWLSSQAGAQATDNCAAVSWTNDFRGLSDDCGATGQARVVFTASDACGNTVQTSATFTILDRVAPTAICQDLRVQLDANGRLNLRPEDVNNGSNDACGNVRLNSLTPNTFDLSNLGDHIVELRIEDDCGNEADCDANVRIESFDLALRKRLADSEADRRLYPGQIVTFTIELFNQGTLGATDIEILDYIPNGLSLADTDWNNNANGTASFTVASLAAGASTEVDISLRVTQTFQGEITNRAEIFKAKATDGFLPIDVDSKFDGNPGNDTEVNNVIDNTGGDEDDADFENIQVEVFDLALQKKLNTTASDSPIIQGRRIVFDLRILNQGTVPATAIRLIDYFPAGLTLADNNWTDNNDGTASYNTTLRIDPGKEETVSIAFTVDLGVEGQLLNFAEISTAKDDLNDLIQDIDSTPDTNNGNDTVVDNVIDNSGGDQDDHDVEAVLVERFDLALIKQFDPARSANPILQDREVTFNVIVLNQGTIAASGVRLVDYFPAALELADSDWTDNGDNTASYKQAITLSVGERVIVPITFKIARGVRGDLVNRAEISDARDFNGRPAIDFDSTPDNIQNNDSGGQVNTADDDNTAGNGKQGEDEDDADPEDITVESFDLALRKTTTAVGTVRANTDVLFTIEIFNQGTVSARNIRINEFLPAGFILSPNDANGWNRLTSNQVEKTLTNLLLPQTSTAVNILLRILPDTKAGNYTNTAEIAAATDNNGDAALDIDATFDDNPNNDRLVNDAIDDDGTLDEDDHDVEIIDVCDIIPPVLVGVPADIELECTDAIPTPPILYTDLTATDESNPNVQLAFNELSTQSSGNDCSAFNYTITRTWTATDICGNSSTGQQVITIRDTKAPEISSTAKDKTVECDGNGNGLALQDWLSRQGGAVANDACGGNAVSWSNDFTAFSDECGATGSATVIFTATDDCGNQAQTTATFTIIDQTNPTIITPASDLTVQCDGQSNSINLNSWLSNIGGALANDVCGVNIQWSNDFTSLNTGCGGTGRTVVTFTASDECGNQAQTTAAFEIIDTIPPSIGIQAKDLTVECDGNGNVADLNNWLNTQAGAGAIDVCGTVRWENNFSSLGNDCGASGATTVTFSAIDECGNRSETTATFTILDRINPVLQDVPTDLTVDCDAIPPAAAVTATDICDAAVQVDLQEVRADGNCSDTYTLTRTWTATDACGNRAVQTQRIS
ncbi:MAG: Ig-like domain-containing protein, partial [Bacteroidota bacterium]